MQVEPRFTQLLFSFIQIQTDLFRWQPQSPDDKLNSHANGLA